MAGIALVTLAVSEPLLRALAPAPGFRSQQDDVPGLYVPDSSSGYVLAARFAGTMTRKDFAIPVVTNDLGMREPPLEPVRPDRTQVVLTVGDSFTFGWGVTREEAWPARLEERLRAAGRRVRVLNAGVPGYNLRQMRAHAGRLMARVKTDVLIVGLFPEAKSRLLVPFTAVSSAVVDSRAVPRMREVEGGFLYTEMHRPWMQRLDFWLDQHSYVGAYSLKAAHSIWTWVATRLPGAASVREQSAALVGRGWDRGFALLLQELKRLNDEARSRHARLLVLLVNNQEPDGSFASYQAQLNRQIAQFCRRLAIPVVDPLPRLVETAHGAAILRFSSDGHWSARAHEVAAEVLAGQLPQDFLTRSAPE